MISRQTRLRFRRVFRRRKRQAIEIGSVTEDSLERYFFKRLMRLFEVRRFVLGWVGLLVLISIGVVIQARTLSAHYTEVKPIAGGTFREGIVGRFTNANPLYAQTEVDNSVSRLLFTGLFSHNTKGELQPDLVKKYTLDKTERIYMVDLRTDARWHDGKPVTADDVVFTYSTIQDPAAKSYLRNNFKGVIVSKVDEDTVRFELSNSLSGFIHSLTVGIIPKHILGEVLPEQLRSSSFNNQSPLGSGPFKFEAVEVDGGVDNPTSRLSFLANAEFYRGRPDLDRFIIRAYATEGEMIEAFSSKKVDAMAGLKTTPEDLDVLKMRNYSLPLTGQVMVFFKNSHDILKDTSVRQALVLGINKKQTLATLNYPVLTSSQPLLRFHPGFDDSLRQPVNKQDQAKKLLDKAGWKVDETTGLRKKGSRTLQFKLYGLANTEFSAISSDLQKQWRELGVEVEVQLREDNELQGSLTAHDYDALLYGISLGFDPDVYPYWHSSQADIRSQSRLNFSEFRSTVADESLEAARTRSDAKNQAIKYRPFLNAWRESAPALALYQPRYLYVTSDKMSGFDYGYSQSGTDRYASVLEWRIRSAPQTVVSE